MGGVVKLATGGKKKSIADIAPEPQKQTKQTASKAETEMAMQKQSSLRARQGRGGLFARSLGDTQDTLGG